jgi:hypothetical protein
VRSWTSEDLVVRPLTLDDDIPPLTAADDGDADDLAPDGPEAAEEAAGEEEETEADVRRSAAHDLATGLSAAGAGAGGADAATISAGAGVTDPTTGDAGEEAAGVGPAGLFVAEADVAAGVVEAKARAGVVVAGAAVAGALPFLLLLALEAAPAASAAPDGSAHSRTPRQNFSGMPPPTALTRGWTVKTGAVVGSTGRLGAKYHGGGGGG